LPTEADREYRRGGTDPSYSDADTMGKAWMGKNDLVALVGERRTEFFDEGRNAVRLGGLKR